MTIRLRHAVLAVCIVVLLPLVGTPSNGTPAAGADRGGGARSAVVGRGDIVTSILGWRRGSGQQRGPGTAPRCWWRTFGDAELEWFVAVAAYLAGTEDAVPLPEEFRAFLGSGVLPDRDVQARICDGRIVEVRFAADGRPRDATQVLGRRMITHLPVPEPVTSPPSGTTVPVGVPVFFSIEPDDWTEVGGSITVDGITAEVRAHPTAVRIIAGDPAASTTTCEGPGTPFDPDDPASPRQQADRSDACTVTYSTASAGRSSTRSPRPGALATRRPETWIGTVTVLWQAEWRTGDGPWTSLGLVPRTRLIERSVGEVPTVLERP